CPSACAEAPTQPGNWTTYTSLDQISGCNETVLFDLAIANPIADTTTPTKLRVCSLGTASESSTVAQKRSQAASDACVASAVATTATLQLTTGGQASGKEDNTAKALEALAQYFSANCDSRLMLSHVDGIFAGVYMGPGFGRGTAASAIQAILDDVKSGSGSPGTIISQLCGVGKSRAHTFGVAVGNITTVQRALQTWNNASCVAELENTRQLAETSIWETPVTLNNATSLPTNGTLATNGTIANGTLAARHDGRIGRRGLCTLTTVQGGDTCTTLAARCGISLADFEKYNPDPTLCAATSSSLMPDQYVCCSDGGMDDLIPKVGADGICFTYHIVEGDTCGSIAGQRGLKVQDIDDFNKGKTFAWYGCDKLLVDTNICLSEGKRPMPYPNKDAVCGPTVVGSDSTYVESNDDLINLNPCPLNACCNVWGNCGISGDFCNEAAGPEGNPGTSALTNGCVSSCGTDIVNTGTAPASYQRVGYYETWNFNRPCLWMSAASTTKAGSSGGGDAYTHVHWAFAAVNTADWTVQINDPFNQWADFKKLNVKRIVSFGGWGYSTDEATYDILREAMSPANRATFAANVAKFLSKEGIDGADFDWEYPGATDIPGTPPGQPDDGVNYIKFLTTLRGVLPAGKSMSIAAPASFWYLKAFPIDKMALTLDYIVFMTYDLHGQWDAGNQYSIEGCPAGNCLRSHVNITETKTALSMITKAGVNTNLIFVGESSYGRSFKMAAAGCEGPDCTFTGDRLNSNAAKGKCTDTAGYISNAEIIQIIQDADVSIHSYYDAGSDSDILVYDETEWVAYMTDTTKNRRRASWKGYNFAGTIDWALDLQRYTDDTPYEVVYVATEIYGGTPAECTGPCILVLPPSSLASATTISFPPYTTSLEFAPGLTSTIVINVPPYTTDAMPFYNVNVTQGLTAGQFIPTGSIDLPPIVTTITGPSGLTQTRTLTLPPW
ncbi:glycoside hydrolase, partial [Thozetella sp. PMI_491]